ncbi:MAG: PEGA domain-containing protein, partial [Myxococcota bacterium]
GLSAGLYDIVIRMLQRDRDRRYPSLDAAARDLRQWLDEHSRQVGAPEVAEWVEGLVGVELEERTRDISPTEGNFVVALHTPPPTSPTAATRLELPPRSRRRGAALGVGLAALVGVSAVGGSLLWEANEEPAVPPPAPAVPPTPVPPVEREAPAPSPPVAPRLTLQSKPEGASVLVGETLLGMTPLRLETLAPGAAHQLTLVKRGYVDAAVTVEPLAPGEERAVEVVLEVKPVPKAPPKGQRQKQPRPDASATASAGEDGYLTLRTTPWTKVTIDGEPYGTTPVFRRRLDPGTHDVLLENEEHGLKVRRKVQIKSGQNLKLDLDLSKP